MSNVYVGQVQGVSLISGEAPAAFCRVCSGGSLTVDYNNVRKVGIGDQLHVRKGTAGIKLNMDVVGVTAAHLALWHPTSAGVQVADFPSFLVECVDGRAWVLSVGQPGASSLSLANAPDAELEATLDVSFALAEPDAAEPDAAEPDAAAAAACVYNELLGFTRNDIAVDIDGILSWTLSNDLGVKMYDPMEGKEAEAKAFPQGYIITTQAPRFACVTSEMLGFGDDAVFADEHTAASIEIACANSEAAEDMTITLVDFVPDGSPNMPLEAEDIVGFAHEFIPGDGTVSNRVQIAGAA